MWIRAENKRIMGHGPDGGYPMAWFARSPDDFEWAVVYAMDLHIETERRVEEKKLRTLAPRSFAYETGMKLQVGKKYFQAAPVQITEHHDGVVIGMRDPHQSFLFRPRPFHVPFGVSDRDGVVSFGMEDKHGFS